MEEAFQNTIDIFREINLGNGKTKKSDTPIISGEKVNIQQQDPQVASFFFDEKLVGKAYAFYTMREVEVKEGDEAVDEKRNKYLVIGSITNIGIVEEIPDMTLIYAHKTN